MFYSELECKKEVITWCNCHPWGANFSDSVCFIMKAYKWILTMIGSVPFACNFNTFLTRLCSIKTISIRHVLMFVQINLIQAFKVVWAAKDPANDDTTTPFTQFNNFCQPWSGTVAFWNSFQGNEV